MIAQESYKKNPWCKEWNNLSAVSIAKLWVLINQDYNNNLKATIRAAGFSDSKVQQLFLDGIGILRPRTKKLLLESELFTELELKLIEASANKIKKDSDAAKQEEVVKYKAIIFTENMSKFKKIVFAVKIILNDTFEEVGRVRN